MSHEHEMQVRTQALIDRLICQAAEEASKVKNNNWVVCQDLCLCQVYRRSPQVVNIVDESVGVRLDLV